jgi:glucose-1-phosphate adenylyltransferase
MNTDETGKIISFQEKPKEPKSNLASMGIYIFKWEKLKQALLEDHVKHSDSDFGKHIIPQMLEEGQKVYAYPFRSYWRDIGTIEAYWRANIDLTHTLPDFNLYDEFWKIYTNLEYQPPQYISECARVQKTLIAEGCEIKGEVYDSVLSPKVVVEEGAIITNSIIMKDCVIKRNAKIHSSIISEGTIIGEGAQIGVGQNIIHETKSHIYYSGITVIGDRSIIPPEVIIGKNCEISGHTLPVHYKDSVLESGQSLVL